MRGWEPTLPGSTECNIARHVRVRIEGKLDFGFGGLRLDLDPGISRPGLLVIANYLPGSGSIRFIDENVTRARAADFSWADAVLVTGMHIQAAQIHDICERARAARLWHRRERRRQSSQPRKR
jgi:hypothetical protein